MKKIKLLPLLAVIPMLASCGSKPSKPSFAKVGNEVKAAKFAADLEKAGLKASFNQEKAMNSGLFKLDAREYYILEASTKKSGKGKVEMSTFDKFEYRHDKENKLAQSSYDYAASTVISSDSYSTNNVEAYKDQQGYQTTKSGKKTYLVDVSKEEKEYRLIKEVDKDNSVEKFLDAEIKERLGDCGVNMAETMAQYEMAEEKVKKNYKFYENGNIFTIEVKYDDEEEVKDEGYKVKAKVEQKVQLDLTEGKLKSKYWLSTEASYEFSKAITMDGTHYEKGDSMTMKEQMSFDASFTEKAQNLKPFDLKGYVEVE